MRKTVKALTIVQVLLLTSIVFRATVGSGSESNASNDKFTATTTNNASNSNISNTNTNSTSGGGGVSIVSHRLIEEFPGSTSIIGEIRNDYTDRDIGATFVDAKFYDSTGQLLDIERTLAGFFNMQPGQRAPFTISISDQSIIDKMANYTITAEQDATPLGDKPAVLKVEIISQNLTEQAPSGTQYKIVGKVINTGSAPATGTSVLATFYDSAGKIIGYEESLTVSPSMIPPGQSSDFIINAAVAFVVISFLLSL